MIDIDKTAIIESCLLKTANRIQEIQAAIDGANDAIVNDTKSSMGDKYETSREMAQQELSRLQQQLNQALQDQEILTNLPDQASSVVGLGKFGDYESIQLPLSKFHRTSETWGAHRDGGVQAIADWRFIVWKGILDEITFQGKSIKILAIQ